MSGEDCVVCGKPMQRSWLDDLPGPLGFLAMLRHRAKRKVVAHMLACQSCAMALARMGGRPCTEGQSLLVGACLSAKHL